MTPQWAPCSTGRRCTLLVAALLMAATALLSAACRRDAAPPAAAPSSATQAQPPWFEDCAHDSGIRFEHMPYLTQRYNYPEIFGAGGCLIDFDGDGLLDVYLVQGGDLAPPPDTALPHNRLFRNQGAGTFVDVTATAGAAAAGYGMGCAAGDHDGDGDTDLYVTNVGANTLLHNNGDGTFTDATASSGVGDTGWGTSATFVDYDRDGALDLFVTNYIAWRPAIELQCMNNVDQRDYCKPTNYNAPGRDTLYHNNGDGTFHDVTTSAGLDQAFGNGLGVTTADFDGNGLIDIYVANDATANQLWLQSPAGRFKNEALLAGCALNRAGAAEAGMGVVAIDIDDDGDRDLFMTHLRNESNTLYINRGDGMFDDRTATAGLSASSLAYTGFGLGIHDFDHDGHRDLYIANGRVMKAAPFYDPTRPYDEPNLLFAGTARGTFAERQPLGGTTPTLVANSRGALFGDLDNDGDIDIVVCNNRGPAHLLRNIAPKQGRWIMFDIRDANNHPARGAAVRVTAASRAHWRHVQPGYSYCSSNDPRVHVGLGAVDKVDDITVIWPDGSTQSFGSMPVDQLHILKQSK